ncbi:MAG: methionine--tRNA ligase subunit beta [Candidatus Sungbacteria bacterium]|nr:methionine--tRNA ligase subunit beta [Candidatus Sungbacteria bacterium]
MISFEEFQKIELRVAKIIAADRVESSEKLLKLKVSFGNEERQVVAGIGKAYDPEKLLGREIVVVANLEPRVLMGQESQGMLLAASDENGPVLLIPDHEVPPGAKIK